MSQVNMGPRKQYVTRLPETVAAAFDTEVATSGLSHSQFIADLLAVKYGLQRPSERFITKRARMAQQMDGLTLDLGDLPKLPPLDTAVSGTSTPGEATFHNYSTRLPQDIAARMEADATQAGLSYSHFIAEVVAARYGVQVPSDAFAPKRVSNSQEVLPLERAS